MTDDSPSVRPLVGEIRTDAEHADLLSFHLAKLRETRAAVEVAKGPLASAKAKVKEQQDELAKRFSEAKNDLGRDYTREYLESLIKDGDRKVRDLVDFERVRARDKVSLNQPVYGQQPDLFPGEETPTAARDEMAWEAEGYLRGLRGDMDEIQAGDAPEFHQAIMRGFERGQATTAERVARALEAKAKAALPQTDEALDLSPPEPGSHEERQQIEKAKRALGVRPSANKVPA